MADTCGLNRSTMRARIGLPASGLKHLSPPPMRLDLPPARSSPATFNFAFIRKSGSQTRGRHVKPGIRDRVLFSFRSLDPHRAVFVFGNLADRVELWIGQNVRGRLDIGERDENHVLLDGEVRSRCELDASPARRDADRCAGLDPVMGKRLRVKTRRRSRLEPIE